MSMLTRSLAIAAGLAFCAFPSLVGPAGARGADPWMSPAPNSAAASLAVQRTFRGVLPSVADYTQTAHTQAKAEEVSISSSSGLASPICGAAICGPNSHWVMWDTPFLLYENKKAKGDDWGYHARSSGFATGLTRMFGEYKSLGLAIGYDERSLKGRDGAPFHEDADAFHAALYGGLGVGESLFFDAYAGFSWTSQRAQRRPAGAEFSANYNDVILSGGLKASYVWCLPNEVRISPSVGLDYSRLHTNGVREREAGGLSAGKATHNSAQLPISLSVNRTFFSDFLCFGQNRSLWTPEFRASFIPRFGADRIAFDSTQGRLESSRIGRYAATLGTGLKVQINDRFILALDYDYRFGGRGESAHLVTGTYGISF